jgi:hypothetical protein
VLLLSLEVLRAGEGIAQDRAPVMTTKKHSATLALYIAVTLESLSRPRCGCGWHSVFRCRSSHAGHTSVLTRQQSHLSLSLSLGADHEVAVVELRLGERLHRVHDLLARERHHRRVGAGREPLVDPQVVEDLLRPKRLVIESRWLSEPPALAGELRPRRRNG